jgi:hypothetical protein
MSPVGGLLSAEPVSRVGVEVGTEPVKGRSVGNATGGVAGGIKTISFSSSFSPAAGTILDCSELTDKTKHDTIRRQIAGVRMLFGKTDTKRNVHVPTINPDQIICLCFRLHFGELPGFRVTLSGL